MSCILQFLFSNRLLNDIKNMPYRASWWMLTFPIQYLIFCVTMKFFKSLQDFCYWWKPIFFFAPFFCLFLGVKGFFSSSIFFFDWSFDVFFKDTLEDLKTFVWQKNVPFKPKFSGNNAYWLIYSPPFFFLFLLHFPSSKVLRLVLADFQRETIKDELSKFPFFQEILRHSL